MTASLDQKESQPILFEDFCDALAQRLKVDRAKLTADASWVKDVGISSVDIVKIVMLLRQKFGVNIKVSQAGKIKTVRDTYQLLSSGESQNE